MPIGLYWNRLKTMENLDPKTLLFFYKDFKNGLRGTAVYNELNDPNSDLTKILEFNCFEDDPETDAEELGFWSLAAFGLLTCLGTDEQKGKVFAAMIKFGDDFNGVQNERISRDSAALDDLFKRMQNFATIYWFAFYENLFNVPFSQSHLDSLIENEINDGILLESLKKEIFPAGENEMDVD